VAELKVKATLDGSNFQSGIGRLGGMADGLKSKLAAAFTVGAIAAGVRKVMEYADAIEEGASRAGISVKALQEWSFGAKQNGADAEKLIGFIERLTDAASDLKNAEGFAKMGINPQGMTPEGLFRSVQSRTQGKGATEIQSMLQSAGMSFKAIGPMVNTLSSDMEKAATAANRLGAVMGDGTVKRLAALNDQLSIIGQILLSNFAPALIAVGTTMLRVVASLPAGKSILDSMIKGGVFGAMRKGGLGALKEGESPADRVKGLLAGIVDGVKGGLKAGSKDAKVQMAAIEAIIEAIRNYKAPEPSAITQTGGKEAPKFRQQSDSLLSVGNFLGAGRGAIDSLQKEANRIAKENGRKLDAVVENTSKTGGTIEVP